MKGWCKIIELEDFDVLVQRLVTKSEGEHVQITVRFADGQYITQAKCGEGSAAEKMAIELFDSYSEEDAIKLLNVFKEAINEKKDNTEED